MVAFSVVMEGDEEVDIITSAASLCGSSVLDTEEDVTVTVCCVDTSDVMSPELAPRVEDKTELPSGVMENVLC